MSDTAEIYSVQDLVTLAEAVAPPGGVAHLLGENNSHTGQTMSITDAVAFGRPYFVRISRHLSVLDYDESEDPQFPTKVQRMVDDGFEPVVRVRSGRRGHEHWYFRVPAGESPRHYPPLENYGIATSRRLWGGGNQSGKTVRPPLSPHRLGLPVELVKPQSVAEAIIRLTPPSDVVHEEVPVAAHMSERTRRLLVDGDVDGQCEVVDSDGVIRTSRSAMYMGVVHAFIRDHLSLDELIACSLQEINKGCAKVHAELALRGTAKAIAYVRNAHESAIAWRERNPEKTIANPDDAVEYLLTAREAVRTYRGFNPKTETTDRAVLAALIDIGLQVHGDGKIGATIEPAPGLRRLALKAGCDRKTVGNSLERLVADGWITQVHDTATGTPGPGRNVPTRYRIQIKTSLSTPSTGTYPLGAKPVDGVVNTHLSMMNQEVVFDAFHRDALGRGARETYEAMVASGSWMTVAEISEVTGKKHTTVRAHLRKLKNDELPFSLVRQASRTYAAVVASEANLMSIAEYYGTSGSTSRREARYRNEQEAQQIFSEIRGIPHPATPNQIDLRKATQQDHQEDQSVVRNQD